MRKARGQYEALVKDMAGHNCDGRDFCKECMFLASLIRKLEHEGWRCCEKCVEFNVAPSVDADVCPACGDDQAVCA